MRVPQTESGKKMARLHLPEDERCVLDEEWYPCRFVRRVADVEVEAVLNYINTMTMAGFIMSLSADEEDE